MKNKKENKQYMWGSLKTRGEKMKGSFMAS
jgi:hypothetical protein